ncbi:radical SAM protein, partial [Elusimicrobiota bacterium]
MEGRELLPRQIADMALGLQEQGCHNINFVTPSHVVPQMLETILEAAKLGLKIPIVYNTGSYDLVETLRLLDGVIDIYMPDMKFWEPNLAKAYLRAENYPERARSAIIEMHRQVGDLEVDHDTGLARRGVLLRHLVMPGCVNDSGKIFKWIATELSKDTFMNVMDQYHPAGAVLEGEHPAIDRRPRRAEHAEAMDLARRAGLHRFA